MLHTPKKGKRTESALSPCSSVEFQKERLVKSSPNRTVEHFKKAVVSQKINSEIFTILGSSWNSSV